MRTIETGIGHPDEDLLRGAGRPGQRSSPDKSEKTYRVGYFRPNLAGDPKLGVRVRDLGNGTGEVIGVFRGRETVQDYTIGDTVQIPAEVKGVSMYVSEGFRQDRKTPRR